MIVTGVAHHVTQRGNNRQVVFHSNSEYRLYLEILGRNVARHGVRVFGYCLMPNHVHLIVVPEREEGLARALGPTHSEYALATQPRARTHGPHVAEPVLLLSSG